MQKHISSMKVKMIPTKKLAIFPVAFCVLIFASSHNASATPLPLPPVINLASAIQGNINFAGSVQFDTQSLATATTVVTWFDVLHNAVAHQMIVSLREARFDHVKQQFLAHDIHLHGDVVRTQSARMILDRCTSKVHLTLHAGFQGDHPDHTAHSITTTAPITLPIRSRSRNRP